MENEELNQVEEEITQAEAAFDDALEDAAYALRNGAQRPKQGELGL